MKSVALKPQAYFLQPQAKKPSKSARSLKSRTNIKPKLEDNGIFSSVFPSGSRLSNKHWLSLFKDYATQKSVLGQCSELLKWQGSLESCKANATAATFFLHA